jgi:hypothetical protein
MRVLSVLIFIIAFAFSLSAQAGNKGGGGGGGAAKPPTGAAAISVRKAGGGGTLSGNPLMQTALGGSLVVQARRAQ